jgi:hypothetical protein
MSTYTCPERARSSSKRSTGAKGLKDIIQDLLYLLPRKNVTWLWTMTLDQYVLCSRDLPCVCLVFVMIRE